MSTNRVTYFIRSILQNSKLNREKFVKNKIKYNISKTKNNLNNTIIKRNMSTKAFNQPKNYSNFSGGGGPQNFMILIATIFGVYLGSGRFEKKK
jgi:hypothetical protein